MSDETNNPAPENPEVKAESLAEKVAASAKKLAEAQIEHGVNVAALEAANKAAEPKPEVGRHVLVDLVGSGVYVIRDAPKGYDGDAPARVVSIDGVSCEHVSEDPETGVWQYRRM